MTGDDGGFSRIEAILAAGRTPTGIFIGSTDPATTDIVGGLGFDFAVFDNEHSPMDAADVLHHVRAAEASGLLPFARISENAPPVIQRFLDIGCQGLIVPHVDTAEDARRAVTAARLPPRGTRGRCSCCHAVGYSTQRWQEYARRAETDTMIIPTIESPVAVENIAEILSVDGIAMVLFGPGDLSQELGVPMGAPEVAEAWQDVRSAATTAGKWVATALPDPSAETDADAIVHVMDLLIFERAARALLTGRDVRAPHDGDADAAVGARVDRSGHAPDDGG